MSNPSRSEKAKAGQESHGIPKIYLNLGPDHLRHVQNRLQAYCCGGGLGLRHGVFFETNSYAPMIKAVYPTENVTGTIQSTAERATRGGSSSSSAAASTQVTPVGDLQSILAMKRYESDLRRESSDEAELRTQQSQIYAIIWERLSIESQAAVERSAGFAAIAAARDALLLWRAVKSTHQLGRAGVASKDEQKFQASQQYSSLKMGATESIHKFHERCVGALDPFGAVELDAPADTMQARAFVQGLHSERYSGFQDKLRNDELLNVNTYPKTMADAYLVASNWHTTVPGKVSTTVVSGASALLASTTSAAGKKHPSTKPEGKRGAKDKSKTKVKASGEKKKDIECWKCGGPHYKSQCGKQDADGVAMLCWEDSDAVILTTVLREKYEKKMCPETDCINQECRMVGVSPSVLKASKHLLPTDLVLDTGASDHVICNAAILESIHESNVHIRMQGLNSGTVLIKERGTLPYFGEMFYSSKAIANILSFSVLSENHKIDWIQDQKRFDVHVGEKIFSFTLKEDLGVYVCDAAACVIGKSKRKKVVLFETVQ